MPPYPRLSRWRFDFASTGVSIAGAICGAAIAIGVPWVVLVYGQVLGGAAQTKLVWVGVIAGALISLTSAFFGLVMPSQVSGPGGNPWDGNPWEHRGSSGEPPAR